MAKDSITYNVKFNGASHIVQSPDKRTVSNWVDEQVGLSIKPASAADVVEFSKTKGEIVVLGAAPAATEPPAE